MTNEQREAVGAMVEYGAAYFVIIVAVAFLILGAIGRWLDGDE